MLTIEQINEIYQEGYDIRLKRTSHPALKGEMRNVQVLGEHQNGPMEAFVYFIDEIGIEKRDFVVADTRSLPGRIYEWVPLLKHETLRNYRSLIVFRT